MVVPFLCSVLLLLHEQLSLCAATDTSVLEYGAHISLVQTRIDLACDFRMKILTFKSDCVSLLLVNCLSGNCVPDCLRDLI